MIALTSFVKVIYKINCNYTAAHSNSFTSLGSSQLNNSHLNK